MALNNRTGNMYEFITHTWNTVKGECYHICNYCYMKRFGKLNPVRFDEKELKTDLGTGNFIFVGSSCDMFAENILEEWIAKTLAHMKKFDNKYFLQTKNPERILDFVDDFIIEKCVVCTTIESDYYYADIMKKAPMPYNRSEAMYKLSSVVNTYVTIEPILDFSILNMAYLINKCKPRQVNIGADSGNNQLPEPSKEKILELIDLLKTFTTVHLKKNLERLLK